MSLNQIFLTAAELVAKNCTLSGEYRHTHDPCCVATRRASDALRVEVDDSHNALNLLSSYFSPDNFSPDKFEVFWFGAPFPLWDYWHIPRKEKSRVRKAKEQRIYALLLLAEISKDLD